MHVRYVPEGAQHALRWSAIGVCLHSIQSIGSNSRSSYGCSSRAELAVAAGGAAAPAVATVADRAACRRDRARWYAVSQRAMLSAIPAAVNAATIHASALSTAAREAADERSPWPASSMVCDVASSMAALTSLGSDGADSISGLWGTRTAAVPVAPAGPQSMTCVAADVLLSSLVQGEGKSVCCDVVGLKASLLTDPPSSRPSGFAAPSAGCCCSRVSFC
mmetsp:Transcript_20875/g.64920  ORF Transcript_20875/g.64920 Transcript_20875/m.64920 type:complete len:220 (+) Transcript_20875:56-715(+)